MIHNPGVIIIFKKGDLTNTKSMNYGEVKELSISVIIIKPIYTVSNFQYSSSVLRMSL